MEGVLYPGSWTLLSTCQVPSPVQVMEVTNINLLKQPSKYADSIALFYEARFETQLRSPVSTIKRFLVRLLRTSVAARVGLSISSRLLYAQGLRLRRTAECQISNPRHVV